MFDRRRMRATRPPSSGRFRRAHHQRAFSGDVSLVTEVLDALMVAREGVPVPVEQLPITQGLALLLADCIADMDLYAVDRAGVRVERSFPVLDQPNPEEERGVTVHKIVQSLFWTGNAYGLTARGRVDASMAVTIVNPDAVGPIHDPTDDLRVAGWLVHGNRRTRAEVAHWKLSDDPRRGPLGETPLRRCSTALGMYGWAYRYLADYFAQGGNPSSLLKTKRQLSDVEAKQHQDDWVSARQRRRPAVLPHDIEFEVPQASGDLAAALQVLDACAAEIARMCNVPPSLVNAPTPGYSLTYNNLNDDFRRWLVVSLGPSWIRRVERGFTQLLPDGYRAKIDPPEEFTTTAPGPGVADEPARQPATPDRNHPPLQVAS